MTNPLPTPRVTEQLTAAGAAIEHESFAIIDREVGAHAYPAHEWPVVRRMIHASADFEMNGLVQFHPEAVSAAIAAVRRGASFIVDVEMIRVGLSKPRLQHFGIEVHEFISDPEVIAAAKAANTTRAVMAMRRAAEQGLLAGSVVAIGNAPTALLEVVRLMEAGQAQPAVVLGMPVGFVSAAESKEALIASNRAPWIVVRGRKGGSTLVVAALHALMALAETADSER
ncbi:precorrin-8X methylmutase [Hydrogenophilus hirschii]